MLLKLDESLWHERIYWIENTYSAVGEQKLGYLVAVFQNGARQRGGLLCLSVCNALHVSIDIGTNVKQALHHLRLSPFDRTVQRCAEHLRFQSREPTTIEFNIGTIRKQQLNNIPMSLDDGILQWQGISF